MPVRSFSGLNKIKRKLKTNTWNLSIPNLKTLQTLRFNLYIPQSWFHCPIVELTK